MIWISQCGRGKTKYHTKKCRNFPENAQQISKTEAERRDLEICAFCEGDWTPSKQGKKGLRQMLKDGDIDYE